MPVVQERFGFPAALPFSGGQVLESLVPDGYHLRNSILVPTDAAPRAVFYDDFLDGDAINQWVRSGGALATAPQLGGIVRYTPTVGASGILLGNATQLSFGGLNKGCAFTTRLCFSTLPNGTYVIGFSDSQTGVVGNGNSIAFGCSGTGVVLAVCSKAGTNTQVTTGVNVTNDLTVYHTYRAILTVTGMAFFYIDNLVVPVACIQTNIPTAGMGYNLGYYSGANFGVQDTDYVFLSQDR